MSDNITITGLIATTPRHVVTAEGLPIGLQIIGRPFDEATVFRIARAYERATDWHTRRPAV